jgi:hypothetical protein
VAQPEPRLEPYRTSLERPENSYAAKICREEWEKLPKYRCAKLVASYPRILKAAITAKAIST